MPTLDQDPGAENGEGTEVRGGIGPEIDHVLVIGIHPGSGLERRRIKNPAGKEMVSWRGLQCNVQYKTLDIQFLFGILGLYINW